MDFLIFREFLRKSYDLDKSAFKILMHLVSLGHRYKKSKGIITAKNIEELAKKCNTNKSTLRKSLALIDFELFASVEIRKNDKIIVQLKFPRPNDCNLKKHGGYIKIPTEILQKKLSSNALKFFIYALDSSNGHYGKKTCIYNIYAQKTLNLSKNTVSTLKNELSKCNLISLSASKNKQLVELKKTTPKKPKIGMQKPRIAPKKPRIGTIIKKHSSNALCKEILKGGDSYKKQIFGILKKSGKYQGLSDFEIENLIVRAKEEVEKRGVITKNAYTIKQCLNAMAYLSSNDAQYGTATILKVLDRAEFYAKNPEKQKMGETEKIQSDFIKNGGEFSEFEKLRVHLKNLYPDNNSEYITRLKNATEDPDKKLIKSLLKDSFFEEKTNLEIKGNPTQTTITAKVIKPDIFSPPLKNSQSEFFKNAISEILKNCGEKSHFKFLN